MLLHQNLANGYCNEQKKRYFFTQNHTRHTHLLCSEENSICLLKFGFDRMYRGNKLKYLLRHNRRTLGFTAFLWNIHTHTHIALGYPKRYTYHTGTRTHTTTTIISDKMSKNAHSKSERTHRQRYNNGPIDSSAAHMYKIQNKFLTIGCLLIAKN